MPTQTIFTNYARSTCHVTNNVSSFSSSATATSHVGGPTNVAANVLSQLSSVKLAMLGINMLPKVDSSTSPITSTATVTTGTSPYNWWYAPMMTHLTDTPYQLCEGDADGLYYSTDTKHWTISTINDSSVKSLSAIAISGEHAIGRGYYLDKAQTQYLMYSADGGKTWTASALVVYGGTTVGTLYSQTGYLCTYTINAPKIVNNYYSTSNGGSSWSLLGSYTNADDDISLSTYSIASSGTNILWSLYNGNIFYSTSTYPKSPPSPTVPDGVSTYIGNFSSGTGSSLAISGSYGLVLRYYDIDKKGVYIINLADDAPALVKCESAGTYPFQGVYISDTPSSSGQISAIVSSQDTTMYCDDITASPTIWYESDTTDSINYVAISGSTAINTLNSYGYINFSSNGGSTWTSTGDS